MSYKITVLKLDFTKQPKGYFVAEVAYKTEDGKVKGMKVLDFVQKDVFATLKNGVKPGDILNADFEQNTKGFWQFAQISTTGEKADVTSASSTSPASSVKSGNWETSVERQARQVMIVRQSSLSNAINYFNLTGHKKAEPEEIINIAKVFEGYVLDLPTGEVA